jgi:hypothetical protein
LIFPSGPNLTHFCLNHFLRSSFKNSCALITYFYCPSSRLRPSYI